MRIPMRSCSGRNYRLALTRRLTPEEIKGLYHAVQDTLLEWIDILRREM